MATFEDIKTKLEAFVVDYSAAQGLSLDLAPGSVISEWVIKLSAALQEEITNNVIGELSGTNTIKAVMDSVAETYNPLMDSIASNYNVERDLGSTATGKIKVTVSEGRTYYLPSNLTFTQSSLGASFQTTSAYTVTLTPTALTDIRLYTNATATPTYYFILPVEAVTVGEIDNNYVVTHNVQFNLGTGSVISGFVSALAYGDFSGGTNQETDKQLVARFKDGLSCKGLMSPLSIKALLAAQVGQDITVSTVGANDVEFTRTKHNSFGIATLGAADVYVRTSPSIYTTSFDVTADYVSDDEWVVVIDNTTVGAPAGIYNILGVTSASTATTKVNYTILSGFPEYGRLIVESGATSVFSAIDEEAAIEARYSDYQTTEIRFTSTYAGVEAMTVNVLVSYMPYVQEMQDFISQSDNRVIASDYLIKGVVPCMVTATLKVHKKFSTTVLPKEAMQKDIFNYINGLQLGEDLVISKIVDICHNYEVSRVDLPLKIIGTIWTPYMDLSRNMTITSTDVLRIPNTLVSQALGVSPKTTAFFASYLDASGTTEIPTINILES